MTADPNSAAQLIKRLKETSALTPQETVYLLHEAAEALELIAKQLAEADAVIHCICIDSRAALNDQHLKAAIARHKANAKL